MIAGCLKSAIASLALLGARVNRGARGRIDPFDPICPRWDIYGQRVCKPIQIDVETTGSGALRPIIPLSASMKKINSVLLPRFGDCPGQHPGIRGLKLCELGHFHKIEALHELPQHPLLGQDFFFCAGSLGRGVEG